MKEKIVKGIFVGGVCIFGGYVVKKLNDIHEEIKYFERQKGIYNSKKEYDHIDDSEELEFHKYVIKKYEELN